MKKVIFFIILLFSSNILLKAECTYKDQVEYNTLSSFVNYNYEFNEESQTFNLTIYNLGEQLFARYNSVLDRNSGESKIYNVNPGTQMQVEIIASEGDCYLYVLRTLYISIPYINRYYNSSKCEGHEELNICNSKFLDYQLTENTFNSLINKATLNEEDKPQEEIIEQEKTFFEKALDLIKEIYIPVILVAVSSLITYLVLSSYYRKIKHGI